MKSSLFRAGLCCLLLMACSTLGQTKPAEAAEELITLGTAGVTGVYYPAGGAICHLVNRNRREHGLRCVVESTGGSITNLEGVRSGDMNLGIAQSDWLYHAYNGTEVFSDQGPNNKLRVAFALHAEPFTIIVRDDSAIKSFDDLKGKRVYMGNPGSGMRATMEELMRIKGWDKKSFNSIIDITPQNQAQALCEKKVDAIIYAVGHPNGAVQQIASMCNTRIVGVSGTEVDALIKQSPFYAHTSIPGGMYLNNPYSVKTFGVRAMLVTTEDMADDKVYEFVKAVFNNLDNFKTLHPVFGSLDPYKMMEDARSVAPMHEGAKRYFIEKGMMQKQ